MPNLNLSSIQVREKIGKGFNSRIFRTWVMRNLAEPVQARWSKLNSFHNIDWHPRRRDLTFPLFPSSRRRINLKLCNQNSNVETHIQIWNKYQYLKFFLVRNTNISFINIVKCNKYSLDNNLKNNIIYIYISTLSQNLLKIKLQRGERRHLYNYLNNKTFKNCKATRQI